MPKRKKGIIPGTRVKGVSGKRTKVVTPFQADVKRWTKKATELAKGSSALVKATGGSVVKPKAKKAVTKVKSMNGRKVVAAKPKGVKARGVSLIKKRLARIKKAAT
jgi:hypothetical protein